MTNAKTGLLALSLLAVAGAALISCGGDSDGGNENTGGKSPTAGTSSGSGGGSAAGSGSGGKTNQGGATAGGNGPGPDPQGGGGPDFPGFGGGGPDFPGFGGEGNVPACPADAQGKTCTVTEGAPSVCYSDGQACLCQEQGAEATWSCVSGAGEGGAGPGPDDFMVDCGDSPMQGDDCDGIGLCVGSQSCGCYNGQVVCLSMP